MYYGEIKIVDNEAAVQNAKTTYNAICVYNEFGAYETLLLTESDLKKMRERSSKNSEDHIKVPALGRFFLSVMRLLRLI